MQHIFRENIHRFQMFLVISDFVLTMIIKKPQIRQRVARSIRAVEAKEPFREARLWHIPVNFAVCMDQRRRKAFTHFVLGKVSQQAAYSSTS
ncbi:hypothetical protein [Klebsiella quasipneumoniae]|uniref:hypothetical protein n=1 Tax=Klebsiella quasipneumoniae TaxID=1463165 RepID=UPI003D03D143